MPPGTEAIKPRTSSEYTATFALLQASIVARSSACDVGSSGNPAENKHKHLAPRHALEISCQRAHREQHRARAELSFVAVIPRQVGPAIEPALLVSVVFDATARSLRVLYSRMQHVGIRREVLGDAQRSAEFHDGHLSIRARVRVDEFSRGRTGLYLVGEGHRRVVEEKNEIALNRFVRLNGGVRAARKL